MSVPRVFIVQEALRRMPSGEVKPKYSVEPLKRFGELVYILDWSDGKADQCDEMIDKIEDKLDDITDEDYLMMSGSPTAMGLAVAVALRNTNGRVQIIMWDRELDRGRGGYKVIDVELDMWQDAA